MKRLVFICLFSCCMLHLNATDNPENFTVSPVSDTETALSWLLNLSGDSVIIAVNSTATFGIPDDGTPYLINDILLGGGTIIYKGNNTFFNHAGLAPNTVYYYSIWSFSSGNIYSSGAVDSIKTYCIPAPSYLSEAFENGGNIPDCWTQENIVGNLNWVFTNGNPYNSGFPPRFPATAFSGNFCAFFGSDNSVNNGNKTKLLLPVLDLSNGTGPAQLGIWACIPSNDVLKIYYKSSFSDNWVLLTTINNGNGNWCHYIYNLPDPSNDYHIALEGTKSTNIKEGISIDELWVCRDNCCVVPSVSAIFGSNTACSCSPGFWWVDDVPGNTYFWSANGYNFSSSIHNGNTFMAAVGGQVCVTPKNNCGYGQTTCRSVCYSDCYWTYTSIVGNSCPCISSTQTYSLNPAPNSPDCIFVWYVPNGWAIIQGQNTHQITVNVGINSGVIRVEPRCGYCSDWCINFSAIQDKTVCTMPSASQPTTINGSLNPCQNSTQTYSVSNQVLYNYSWTVPPGWTILNGQNTHSITVTVGSTSGNITVTPTNPCGTGPSRQISVSPQLLPPQPSTISGVTSTCSGSSQSYWTTGVSGVNYNWSFPVGWIQTGGSNTDSITVTVGATNGNIVVTPVNSCGAGTPTSLSVSVMTFPLQPDFITGEPYPCIGSEQMYSVANVTDVTYTWYLPSDWLQTGGGVTNQITVTTGTDAGNITVTPENTCGTGLPQTLAVSPEMFVPQNIFLAGDTIACEGDTITFSATIQNNVNYNWQFPAGWIQTDGGHSNYVTVVVTLGNSYVSVIPENSCGTGNSDSVFVSVITVPEHPGIITGDTLPCEGSIHTYSIAAIQGVNYLWCYPVSWAETGGNQIDTIQLEVGDLSGIIQVLPSNSCGDGPSSYLTVTPNPIVTPDVDIFLQPSTNVCIGDPVIFSAIPVNEGGSPVYAWYYNDSVSGNLLTFEIAAPNDGDYVYFVMQPDGSCLSTNHVNSDTIYINVHSLPAPPVITINSDTLISSYATGNQWYYNGQPISVSVNYECPFIGDGQYYVVYTDTYGCSTTSDIILITSQSQHAMIHFKVYPNPSSDNFIIECNVTDKDAVVYINDVLGRTLFEKKLDNYSGKIIVPADEWGAQVLFCILSVDGKKLIIQKLIKTE